jgi:hypothetical protein
MEAHVPARYREEMKALAGAAGVPYDDVLVGNVMVELFQQCSTAVVRGARAEGGTLLFGRNLDFPPEGILEKHSVVIDYAPAEGRRFVAVTWPGLVGVLSGMNRDGLCVATASRRAVDGRLPTCSSCGRARGAGPWRRGRAPPAADGQLIMLADAKGAAVAEATHERLSVREIEDNRLFATNDFRADTDVRCDRYDKLVDLVAAAKAPLDAKDMEWLLGAVDLGDINVQCMVFIPERREICLSLGRIPAAKEPFVTLRPETDRQRQHEARAAVRGRLVREVAAEVAREAAGEREPETEPAHRVRLVAPRPLERAEEPGCPRNPRPMIQDRDPRDAALDRRRDLDRRPPVLARVLHQIE